MVRERSIGEHRLHEHPVPGRKNKFVITEGEAWFLPFEDNTSVPSLGEILAEVLGIDLSDEEAVAEADAKLEDGRVLLGYVSADGRDVSVHSLPDPQNMTVRRRLAEV